MSSRIWKLLREHFAFTLKCGAVLGLFLVSFLVAACGANNTATAPGAPPVTLTINLNQTFASPTPTMAPYSCGAWVTFTTPAYNPNSIVEVYAKYVQNVDGNPQGMDKATAIATIQWPGAAATTVQETTGSDGLATFPISMQASALNHVVLITVTFTSQDGQHTCTTPSPAFFTAVAASPTPTATPTQAPTPDPFPGQPTPSPTSGGGFPFPTPTVSLTPPHRGP
jgi:hypothetical protein